MTRSSFITRRSAIRLAAGTAVMLSGCARPQPRATAPVGIAVKDSSLFRIKQALSDVWGSSGSGFPITISATELSSSVEADQRAFDIIGVLGEGPVDPSYRDLTADLNARNFNSARFRPSAIAPFQMSTQGIRALPLVLSEWQFYVNAPGMRAVGMAMPATWTWGDVIQALGLATVLPHPAPVVTGEGWGNISLWGAFVLGMGGTFTRGDRVDLSGAVDATRQLVEWVKNTGWKPDPGVTMPPFAGPRANSLFGFYEPWTIAYQPSPDFVRLPISPFPRLPIRDVVPAARSFGLAVSPYCAHPQLAMEFLLWLYSPDQQRLLASQDIPPVISDPDVMAYWAHTQSVRPQNMPVFDLDQYTNVLAALPPAGWQSAKYQPLFTPAFKRMMHGSDVGTELEGVQKQIDAMLSFSP